MEFTLKSDVFKALLDSVSGTYGSSSMPILSGIYFQIDANGNGICRASNGLEATQTKFQPVIPSPGEAVINGYVLTKIANTLATGDVTITVDPATYEATLQHATGELQIHGMEPSQYPAMADFQEDTSFVIPAKDFDKAVKKVEYARILKPSSADMRFSGVALQVKAGKATLIGCDRMRGARYEFDAPSCADTELILNPKLLHGGIGAVSGNIAVRMSQTGICLETNDTTYIGPVIAAKYPNISQIFINTAPATALVPTQSLKDVLVRVGIIADASKSDPDAEFEFDPATGLKIIFSAKSGKINEIISNSTYSGAAPISTKLNTKLMLEGINHAEKDNVEFLLGAAHKAIVIYPEGEQEFGYFILSVN